MWPRGSCTLTQPAAGGRSGVLIPPRTHAWHSHLSKQVYPLMKQPDGHHSYYKRVDGVKLCYLKCEYVYNIVQNLCLQHIKMQHFRLVHDKKKRETVPRHFMLLVYFEL